jgi:hypothetical protein
VKNSLAYLYFSAEISSQAADDDGDKPFLQASKKFGQVHHFLLTFAIGISDI